MPWPIVQSRLQTAGRPAADALQQPPSIPGDQLDTLTVPQGTPEELMKFINQLGNRLMALRTQIQQGGATPAALQPILEAMLEASNKSTGRPAR